MVEHTKLYAYLPTKDKIMFMSILNPKSDFHFRIKVRRFAREVDKAYLEVGQLSDQVYDLKSKIFNTSKVFHSALEREGNLIAVRSQALPDSGPLCSFDDYVHDRSNDHAITDLRIEQATEFATGESHYRNKAVIEGQIINIYESIKSKFELLSIGHGEAFALIILKVECSDEVVARLKDILQAGKDLKATMHRSDSVSSSLSNVR